MSEKNLNEALRGVRPKRLVRGVDGMTVGQTRGLLKPALASHREHMLKGLRTEAVRRVEIPKTDGGGMRKLGILPVGSIHPASGDAGLQRRWDPTFFAITATGSGGDGRLITQWHRRSSTRRRLRLVR